MKPIKVIVILLEHDNVSLSLAAIYHEIWNVATESVQILKCLFYHALSVSVSVSIVYLSSLTLTMPLSVVKAQTTTDCNTTIVCY